jgi:hypothetical protein
MRRRVEKFPRRRGKRRTAENPGKSTLVSNFPNASRVER